MFTFALLGADLGWGTAFFIPLLSIIIGLSMNRFFPEKKSTTNPDITMALPEMTRVKSLPVQLVFFGLLFAIMILTTGATGRSYVNYIIPVILFGVLVVFLIFTFTRDDMLEWGKATLQFIRSIIPWLLVGSLGAALISVLLPPVIVSELVGGNSILACFISSVIGSLLYFCSLAQVPFIRALMDLGMGKGPALALQLTGAAVSLPSMLVLVRIMGARKTITYIGLVVILATVSAFIFGLIVG